MSLGSIAVFEWRRVFATKRGWIAILALLLVWLLVLMYVIAPAARYISNPDTSALIDLLIGDRVESLRTWPTPEVALYWIISLYLLPFFAVIISADQMASDRARGTLRYLLLRTSRSELFFGRFIGQSVLMLLLVLASFGSVLALIALYSADRITVALQDLIVVVPSVWLVLLPFVAVMALLSVVAKSALQAIVYWVIVWIVITITVGYIQRNYGPFPLLEWMLPGSQLSSMIKNYSAHKFELASIPVIHTIVLLVVGWWVMRGRDL